MKLSDFFEKYVRVFTCIDLIIIGDVIDYYPATSTESGEDEIDIFPDGINHIIRVKESEIVAIEEIFLDSNAIVLIGIMATKYHRKTVLWLR